MNESGAPALPEALLQEVLGAAYARRGVEEATLTLLVVDDETISRYNWEHLQHEGPTDVLAFEDGEADPETGRLHLGDLMVSYDTARRESAARGLEAEHELTLYALHGLLHLLGMRDHDEESQAAMVAAQRDEFERQGLPFQMEV